ncbi:MAG: prolipoprotein diacylglyceryl transferase [Anaerovoracaceae bacterium]
MQAPDPVAFSIFGLDIRWYGILISAAFLLAILICYRRAPKHGIESERILDLAVWLIPFSVIGARAYYVLFEWDNYRGDIAAILDIRSGGLAIHGGLIAGFIVSLLVCRHYKIKVLELADLVFPEVALAQAIGRWGNFFNSEAHGGPTDLPWGIMVDGQKVHPTFLYESIWCLLLFIFLIWLDKRRSFPGQIACLYGMLYSIERFCVESLRTDSLMIGRFRQAQVISVCIFISCLVIYIYLLRKKLNSVSPENAGDERADDAAAGGAGKADANGDDIEDR